MEAARIFATIGANTAGFVRGMTAAGGAVSGFAAKAKARGKKIAATGRSMTRSLTLPIIGVGAAAGKMSLDFEKSMTDIRALVGASESQMAGYEKAVLSLARTTPQGPKELADALYFVVSSGFEGASALKVLNASAKAAAAGLGSTASVADAVTSAVNAYGEKALSASRATDVLLAAVREGKAEPDELAGAIGRVIAPAEAMGVEFHEVAGAVAALSMGGLKAAEGVTAIRAVLSTLMKPTQQARKFLKKTGESIQDLREEVADKGLLPTLQRLRDRFGDNKDALGKLFPNVRALNGFLALTGANAKKNADVMGNVAKAVGDTDKAFQAASESAGFKLKKAWSNIQVDLIQLGNTVVPVFARIVQGVSNLARKFTELPKGTQNLILFAALGVAALGPLLTVIGNVTRAVGLMSKAIAFLAANPYLLVIAGFVAGTMLLANKFGLLRGKTDETKAAFDRAKLAAEGYKNALDRLKGTADSLIDAQLAERASTLALQRAKVTAGAVIKEYGRKSLEAKEAILGVKQAQRDLARATEGVTTAQGKNDRARADHLTGLKDTRVQLENLRGKYMGVSTATRKLTPNLGKAAGGVAHMNQQAKSNAVDGFSSDLEVLIKKLGGSKTSAGHAAQAVMDFVRKTGRIPTKKEMKIIADAGAANRTIADTRARASRPVFMPVIARPIGTTGVQPRALGGAVEKGNPYMVGERGRELFVPDVAGMIVSNSKLQALMRSPWSSPTVPPPASRGDGGPLIHIEHYHAERGLEEARLVTLLRRQELLAGA